MKRYSTLIVFIVALIVRVVYAVGAPSIISGPDSVGYYEIGRKMFAHPSLTTIVNPYRTPLYPFFINAVFYSIGLGGVPIGFPNFANGIQIIVAIQTILGAASFAVMFHVMKRWLPNASNRILGIGILLDVFVLGWERSIMTEGLAISLVLLTTAVLLQTIVIPTKRYFILLFFLFAVGFLLRPALLTLPLVTLPILAWYFRNKRVILVSCIFTFAIFFILPMAYASANRIQYGYSGIQTVGDIDILGRILETNVPVTSAKTHTYFYTTVRDYESKRLTPHPYRFLEYYDKDIYDKMYRFEELGNFNQTVLIHTWPAFLLAAVRNIPDVLFSVSDFTLVKPNTGNAITRIIWVLQYIYGYFQYLTILVPVLWVFSFIRFLMKPTPKGTALNIIGAVAVSQILLTAAIVYHDIGSQYGRVMVTVRIQMFLFLFLSVHQWFTRKKSFRDHI